MFKERIEKLETGIIEASLRAAAAAEGVSEAAMEDIVLHTNKFTVDDDGKTVRDRDGGSVRDWMRSMKESRPHWFNESGAGRTDAGGKDKTRELVNNPWMKAHWNVTEQGRIIKTLGEEKAAEMARAAGFRDGNFLGATRPVK